MTSNLPNWPGEDVVYSKAYRVLEEIQQKYMAGNTKNKSARGWKKYLKKTNWPPVEVQDLIDALNKGDEEFLKGALMQYSQLGYLPRR